LSKIAYSRTGSEQLDKLLNEVKILLMERVKMKPQKSTLKDATQKLSEANG
jgi:hypothetical protein